MCETEIEPADELSLLKSGKASRLRLAALLGEGGWMEEMTDAGKPGRRVVDDDEVFCDLDEYPPLLDIREVQARCVGVETVIYSPWKSKKLVFKFAVIGPHGYEGIVLRMFVNLKSWPKRPPTSSKLAKVAKVAGCQRKFTKSSIIRCVFRCRVGTTKTDPPYSVIETILEKLTP